MFTYVRTYVCKLTYVCTIYENYPRKIKNIRVKFRKAVDAGKRSGNGRVVHIYYELCEKFGVEALQPLRLTGD